MSLGVLQLKRKKKYSRERLATIDRSIVVPSASSTLDPYPLHLLRPRLIETSRGR
jgi:hypothetical protein